MESQDNASQNAEAVTTDSAPVTETNALTSETPEAPAVKEEASAPSTAEPAVETTEEQGAEPSKAVKELIAQRKRRQEAEKDAAYWRGVAEARVQTTPDKPAATGAAELARPSLDDFETYEAYEAADKRYTIELAKKEFREEQKAILAERSQQNAATTFKQKLEKAAESDTVLADAISDMEFKFSPVMAQVVQVSDKATEIIKYLYNNKKESERISKLHPMLVAKELGGIEATLKLAPKAEPPKKVSQAPAPIKTVTPAGNVQEFDPETAPMEEYYKRRMAELRPNRR